MGIRYILLGLALWLLFSTLRRYIRQRKQKVAESRHPVNMVACNHCGVHLAQEEAIHKEKNYYCCLEHSRLSNNKEKQ
jgi:uncharacterized protein